METVRRVYAEIVDSPDAVRELYHPDYELDLTDAGPDIGIVRGFDAADEALRAYWDMFDEFAYEIIEVLHADDERVVTAARDQGRMKGSDSDVTNSFFHVWTFREGKVARISAHNNRNGALEAAGLAE